MLCLKLFLLSPYHSINKQNSEFTPNTDETVCQGHKWGLLALWRYMRTHLGVNTERVWDSIKDLIIKTIISSEPYVSSYVKAFVRNRLEHSAKYYIIKFHYQQIIVLLMQSIYSWQICLMVKILGLNGMYTSNYFCAIDTVFMSYLVLTSCWIAS